MTRQGEQGGQGEQGEQGEQGQVKRGNRTESEYVMSCHIMSCQASKDRTRKGNMHGQQG